MLRNRVRCATTTTGTGTITIGAAAPGFQSFAAAYGASATVQYVIEDGSAWEVGRGTYTYAAGAGTLSRDTIEASSAAGAAVVLSGAATVSVTFLASDNVGDWPLFVANLAYGFNISSAFTGVNMQNIVIDTHGGWDGSQQVWVVPQGGIYDLQGKMRLADNSTQNVSYGLGMDTANEDSPSFLWGMSLPTTNYAREGIINRRVAWLDKGSKLRLVAYAQQQLTLTSAELIAFRIR